MPEWAASMAAEAASSSARDHVAMEVAAEAPPDHVLWGAIEAFSDSADSTSHSNDLKIPGGIGLCPSSSDDSGFEAGRERSPRVARDHPKPKNPGNITEDVDPADVPCDSDGEPTSIGSRPHPDNCVPCCFMSRKDGCLNGIKCNFCHFPHDYKKPKKHRPCKGQRLRHDRQISSLREALLRSPETFDPETVELPPSIESNPDLKAKVIERLKEDKEQLLTLDSGTERKRGEPLLHARFSL